MTRITMSIDGMTCGHCVGAVTRTLAALDGVQAEQVAVGTAVVTYDPARIAVDRILKAVTDEGYPARVAS